MCCRDGVGGMRCAAGLLGQVGGEALVEALHGHVETARGATDELLGLRRLLAVRARSVSGRPTTTRSASCSRTSSAIRPSPRLVAGTLDDAERPRDRSGRVGDRDAGARRAVVEGEHLHAIAEAISLLRDLVRLGEPVRVLTARLGQRRAAAASAADLLRRPP